MDFAVSAKDGVGKQLIVDSLMVRWRIPSAKKIDTTRACILHGCKPSPFVNGDFDSLPNYTTECLPYQNLPALSLLKILTITVIFRRRQGSTASAGRVEFEHNAISFMSNKVTK